ncbi:MAG: C-GCAxxG-C-C family protein [Candidatus Hodarchaeota archaeon]
MKKVSEAVSMVEGDFNCSQAIFSTYGPENVNIDRELCLKIAENFGGGIGYLGNVCGAVTGAVMVIGASYGRVKPGDYEAKAKTNNLTNKFIQQFKARNNTIICKELIDFDISTKEKREQAREQGIFENCPNYVKDAAEILEELLRENE